MCAKRAARAAGTEGAGAVVFPWFHWSQLSQGFTERRKTSCFLQPSQWWHRIKANICVGTCQTIAHGPGYQTADRIAFIIIWRVSAWRYQLLWFGCVSPCFASPPTHKNLMIYCLTCRNHTVPIIPKSQSLAHSRIHQIWLVFPTVFYPTCLNRCSRCKHRRFLRTQGGIDSLMNPRHTDTYSKLIQLLHFRMIVFH